eukprot:scaffold1217_cov250-Pinguiococcus_pyrenoidosus.AAC.4
MIPLDCGAPSIGEIPDSAGCAALLAFMAKLWSSRAVAPVFFTRTLSPSSSHSALVAFLRDVPSHWYSLTFFRKAALCSGAARLIRAAWPRAYALNPSMTLYLDSGICVTIVDRCGRSPS